MNISTPIFQVFNYSELNKDLATQGKETYLDFTGFVSHTFNGLIQSGGALQNFKDECLNSDKNGKKLFSKWLESFGALRHIAISAMKLYNWFISLNPVRQEYLRTHVQAWKISALSLLPRLADNIIDEAISRGKKTASQIKQLVACDSKKTAKSSSGAQYQDDNSNGAVDYQHIDSNGAELAELIEPECEVELVPGVRVVAKTNNIWNGQAGVITKIFREDQFWVVFDYVSSEGNKTLELLNRSELEPEVKRVVAPAPTKKMYTEEELQAKIAEALATKDREEAELREAKYKESYDAGQKAVSRDMAALEKHARNLTEQKEQLTAQLQQATEEIQRLRALDVRNKQLEQRVDELEKALQGANRDSWNNTLNKQAAKVISREVEKTVAPLMSEVERLQNLNAELKQELAELDAFSSQQQQELDNYRRLFNHSSDTQTSKQINQQVPVEQELQYH